jgi:nucleoside-diphosphate-sugar epimerase
LRVLVTGGAGFIGHHLVRTLLDRGDDVMIIDNFATGFRERLEPYRGLAEVVEGDIRDAAALDRAAAGRECIFHEAGLPSVSRSVRDPRLSNDVNTAGTIEVMLAASRQGVRRVILAGSSSVYGDSNELPRREEQMARPRSPYATSKLAAEFYLHTLGQLRGVETVALRYFNVFGPGQDPDSEYAAAVPKFITAALRGERPVVYGDGGQSRDFTYVDNIVSANLLAAAAAGVSGLTCNVGAGEQHSVVDLLAAIGREVGTTVSPVFEPARAGDVPHSLAAIDLARERLGYSVVVSFAEGVARTVASYRDAAVRTADDRLFGRAASSGPAAAP